MKPAEKTCRRGHVDLAVQAARRFGTLHGTKLSAGPIGLGCKTSSHRTKKKMEEKKFKPEKRVRTGGISPGEEGEKRERRGGISTCGLTRPGLESLSIRCAISN